MLVRLDALFEGVLGIVLLLVVAAGVLDGSDFPHPVGTALLLIAGLLLLALCGLIWSRRVECARWRSAMRSPRWRGSCG